MTAKKILPETSAEMAAEVALPTQPPAGAPTLLPMGALTRAQRAAYWACLKELPVDADGNVTVESETPAGIAAGFKLMADIEAALRVVVMPIPGAGDRHERFDAWARVASDETLMELFGWYQNQMQPGEAEPSPNS